MKQRVVTPGRRALHKAEYQRCVRVNISLPPELDGRKNELCRKFAMPGFSDWVQAEMRRALGLDIPV